MLKDYIGSILTWQNRQPECVMGLSKVGQRTYTSIFCARNLCPSKQKREVIIIHNQNSLSEVEVLRRVSEKGSVVCKTGMAFLTLDIHQLSERWQRISFHSLPDDPLLKRAQALPISSPDPTFEPPWKRLEGACVPDLRQKSLYLSSSTLL